MEIKTNHKDFITVLVTAYNRKSYLLKALESAVNQTLDREHYEIILIKNYREPNIDNYCIEHSIKNIIQEGSIGQFLYIGIQHSTGNIIAFLDDDDFFCKNKLEIIFNKFSNSKVVYIKNKYISNVKIRYQPIDSNMSAISIRRNIIYMPQLKEIQRSPDTFMYMCALESDGIIINLKKRLSFYSVHNSMGNKFESNAQEFIKVNSQLLEEIKISYIFFKSIFLSKTSQNFIDARLIQNRLQLMLFIKNKMPNIVELISFIIYSKIGMKSILVLCRQLIFLKLNYNKYRKIIINKKIIN